MNTNKIRLIIIMLTVVLSLYGFIRNAYAPPYGLTGGGTSSWNMPVVTAPITVPPQVPPWHPHGFPHVWTTEDVINALNERGVEVNNISFEVSGIHDNLPAKAKEIVKFSVSVEDLEGTILSFEFNENLHKVRKYYLELNKKGELYTWSFLKDNILLVLPGTIEEEKAKKYKKALNSMQIK
ncbi:MAG: hypothetical protein AB1499_00165 [Nitrospirota bacterium]